jgi:hypothetical protein
MAGVAVLCATGVAAAVAVAVDRNFERPGRRLVARALEPAPTRGSSSSASATFRKSFDRLARGWA